MTERDLRDAMKIHGNTVYRLALCRMQSVPDAEDVYQDVFLRLLEQRAEDWDGERTRAWLIRTTLNRCADLHRFHLRRPTLSLEEMQQLAEPDSGNEADTSSELWVAVAGLPSKLRMVIHLHYGEGYSTEEIADMLKVPSSTVRTRLYRARERLKTLLGGWSDV